MPGKRKPTAAKKRPATRARAAKPAPAGFTDIETLAAQQGVKPVEDMEKFIEEFRDLWPDEKEIDEFLAWLQESRREGRKDR
jgi:hypothetical protein